jgi:hypothetical protein
LAQELCPWHTTSVWEEDDAVALVRVYCGLASADLSARPATAGTWLTAAVVDDAGRLLDVCEVSDDPAGYAHLCALLAERSGGPNVVAIAADSDDHQLTMLLSTAGRPLAVADDDSADDYAERFADDESAEEMESPAAERRAVGLARALQAGALSATTLPGPRDLAGLKGILIAHAALTTGRHSAAIALREVLRELHPAALRAYPDPAEPVPLAVLDALPEPNTLGAAPSGRNRDASATDAIVDTLAKTGVADAVTIKEAITALRVAIAETPRRNGLNKTLNEAIAETVRQAVAAVRACDAACAALVATLSERITAPAVAPQRTRAARRAATSTPAATPEPVGRRAAREPEAEPATTRSATPRRSRPLPAAASAAPATPQPMTSPPVAPRPVAPPPVAPMPVAPAPVAPASAPPYAPAAAASGVVPVPTTPPPGRYHAPPATTGSYPVSPAPVAASSGMPATPVSSPAWVTGTGSNRPVSVPPPPPGITPIVPSQRTTLPPAAAGEPFRPTLTTAAMNRVRAARQGASASANASANGDGLANPVDQSGPATFSATDYSIPVPAARPETPPPGSRSNWPLNASDDDHAATPLASQGSGRDTSPYRFGDLPQRFGDLSRTELRQPSNLDSAGLTGPGLDPARLNPPGDPNRPMEPIAGGIGSRPELGGAFSPPGRITPPWQADDLPPEPPTLRLVEPPPLADRALRDAPIGELPLDAPPLRLVESEVGGRGPSWSAAQDAVAGLARAGGRSQLDADRSPPPVSDEGDGDLLIFAQARSAWFVGHDEDEPNWASVADFGWRAAEQAARPAVGAETTAGLPKRVPQANLVPGSPLTTPDRSLQIIRDPASIAAHTSGYFRGWRRGQEINGYAVGGRPGRESARGWDFSRDSGRDDEEEYGYRSGSAGRR